MHQTSYWCNPFIFKAHYTKGISHFLDNTHYIILYIFFFVKNEPIITISDDFILVIAYILSQLQLSAKIFFQIFFCFLIHHVVGQQF